MKNNRHALAARLSLWVYGDSDFEELKPYGVIEGKRFESTTTDTQGAVGTAIDLQGIKFNFLVFRGTEIELRWGALKDIINDLGIEQVPSYLGLVHAGFKKAGDSVLRYVLEGLFFDLPILVCGHSLGGAIAHYVGTYLSTGNNIEIVTFGEPCLCSREAAVYSNLVMGDKHTRYTQKFDIVPHLPPLPRWKHAGKEVVVGNGMHAMGGYLKAILKN
jgi:hypothetical protein